MVFASLAKCAAVEDFQGQPFEALGQSWMLVDAEQAAGRTEADVVGVMEVGGRSYSIIPGAGSQSGQAHNSHGRIAADVVAILTPRELQVCELIAAGRCDKQIARSLGISTYTEREHVRRIFAKLHISRRAAVLPRMLGLTELHG